MHNRAMRVDEFEELIKRELSSLRTKNDKTIRARNQLPLKKKLNSRKPRISARNAKNKKSNRSRTPNYKNRHGQNDSPRKSRPPRARTPLRSRTPQPNHDKNSIVQLQKFNRKGYFEDRSNPRLKNNRSCLSQYTTPIRNKGNRQEIGGRVTPSPIGSRYGKYQDENSRCDDLRQSSINSFGVKSRSQQPKKRVQKAKRMAQFEEELNFRPRLSKKSLLMASYLESPMDRLTKRLDKKSKVISDMNRDCTFTPKINKKSKMLDRKRGRGKNRYQQLHKLAESYQKKKDQLKREKDMKISKDELECVFQPELISNYTPDCVNDLSFVQRSYLWRQRRDQKIQNARSRKSNRTSRDSLESTALPLKSNKQKSYRPPRPSHTPGRMPKSSHYLQMNARDHHDIKVRSIRKSIEKLLY